MIRFYNGKVLSFGGGTKVSDDEVWTDGGKIVYIGKKREDMPEFEREFDLKGDLLMPGFKNAHTHTAMTFLRSYAENLPLASWLSEKVWPAEAKLTDDSVRVFTTLGIMEYLSSGITSCFEMYSHTDAFAQAAADNGFRMAICCSMNDFDKDYTVVEREFLKYNNASELLSYKLGIHAEYTTCDERVAYVAELAEKYKAPCYLHLSETAAEVRGCYERLGKGPVARLDDFGFFRYGGGAFHCVHLSDEELAYFKEHNLSIITNPASNLKLASGIAPIQKYMDAGITIGIGTDGAASNNALDMFREMYLVSVLQKYLRSDAAACDADSVLKMACSDGAKAMGLDDCDDLAVGKCADLIVIDLHRPNMQPINNITKNLVYSGSKENVRMTMVNGKILYENGEFFLTENAEDVYAEANSFARSILS